VSGPHIDINNCAVLTCPLVPPKGSSIDSVWSLQVGINHLYPWASCGADVLI
jgi:hypothetical protein